MRPSLFLGALALLLMVLTTTDAAHCTTWSTSPAVSLSPATVTVGDPIFLTYVAIDVCQPECLFSIWTYAETNGIEGLQRGDSMVDDTCHGMIESDGFICSLLPMAILSPGERKERSRAALAMAGVVVAGTMMVLPTADAC